jgi:hypothetical protein
MLPINSVIKLQKVVSSRGLSFILPAYYARQVLPAARLILSNNYFL